SSASLSFNGLFEDSWMNDTINSIDGKAPANPGPSGPLAISSDAANAEFDTVGPDFFSTAGVPILMGREIGPQDQSAQARIGVINHTMALRLSRDQSTHRRAHSAA